MTLPTAAKNRWQPLRTGLVDLFYYDYQEFWFRDGRILFRGNNGTGKSKVLALTLPFLLDGELTPSRVEPDGDRAKKMEWNLLLGGRYEERLGYSFLEFGRVTEDGERAYVTIGIGMKAVAGRGIADRWFFLTSQRIGEDLHLIGPNGTALTKDRLIEAIGEYGQVTQVAGQYRRMIDEHLFQLGPDRYESLINLLIQLRQPQLSKRPDEAKLSRALSDALTPVDQAVLSDIAAAFHDLEQQRAELAALRDTRRHVTRFTGRYQQYAAIAARRQTGELRTAHAAYEGVQRNLADVGRVIAEATAEEETALTELAELRVEHAEQTAIKEELTSDPKLKNLADAQRYAAAAQKSATAAQETARKAAEHRDDRAARREAAAQAAVRTRRDVAVAPASTLADQAGFGTEHQDLLRPLNLPDGPYDDDLLRAAERKARTAADRRSEAVAHVSGMARRADQEASELKTLRGRLAEGEAERDGAGDRLGEAQENAAQAAERHVGDWRAYRRTLTVLELPDPDDTGLALWAETLDGANPMRIASRNAATEAERALAAEFAEARGALAGTRSELAERVAERERLDSGAVDHPPVPYTRQEGVRQGRGAAFWQVVDFAPGLPEADRAGLEAALEAAGLLDAWITPDGRLVDGHDTVVLAGRPVPSNLTGALVPAIEPGCEVTEASVQQVLGCVGLGEQDSAAWVSVGGRWRLGPLHGSWAKESAAFVGHAAREEARRRRIAELATLITGLEAEVVRLGETLQGIAARQAMLGAELGREPQEQVLRDAHSQVTSTTRELERFQAKVDGLVADVGFKEDDLAAAIAARDEAAAELRLPVDTGELAAVDSAVGSYRQAMSGLLAAGRVHAGSLRALADWEQELSAALVALAEAEETAVEAAERAASERSRLQALQDAIGASVEELRARLAAAIARLGSLDFEVKALDERHRAAQKKKFKAQGLSEGLGAQLTEASQRRDEAVVDLERFAGTGLLSLACEVELPDSWAATNAVELARRAEDQLKETDDSEEAWRRIQDEISRRFADLSEALSRHGHHAVAGLEGWLIVTVQFQGRERRPVELAELLGDEIGYRERILSARERDLLEDHLVNDVAGHLQELITDAEAQVRSMNTELDDRPTSTGMKLRLQWLPAKDGPEGLAEARKRLLRQNPDLWSPADRAAVGAFLQQQIEAERSRDEHGTWQEHLRQALDYRSWHTFKIERFQDGAWRPGTGPASGGERVLTVSLPLFAAASSQYRSAHQHAPRLVALDEAFAGVDDDSRAKCLGLLATFDLDVVMTSEREWGFYPTVPGLAAHHLVRRDGIDAVHVTSWEWDGHTPTQVNQAVPDESLF